MSLDPIGDGAPVDLDEGSAEEAFEISVKGEGIEVVRSVDRLTALEVIRVVLGSGSGLAASIPASPRRAARLQSPGGSRPSSGGVSGTPAGGPLIDARTTVGEYITSCDAQGFPAKITAIGNYLEFRNQVDYFSKDDIKAQFRPAGESLPSNFPRDFNDAISKRWIAVSPHDKDQYFVTNTGKAAIEARFARSARKASTTSRRRSRSSKADSDTVDGER
jgi:hypothetical protein